MNVVYIVADAPKEFNSSNWRCMIPAKAINSLPDHNAYTVEVADFLARGKMTKSLCEKADVIVLQRNLDFNAAKEIMYWRSMGHVVVLDLDDAYAFMDQSTPQYEHWHKGLIGTKNGEKVYHQVPFYQQLLATIQVVNAITAPSQVIINDWADFNYGYCMPNYLDTGNYKVDRPFPNRAIVIGWGGSTSHLKSWADSRLVSAIKKVVSAHDNVVLGIAGNEKVFDYVRQQIPGKTFFWPWVGFEKWPNTLNQFDIGLAPLTGKYDERRSPIKVLEYMLMGIPWIASDISPYKQLRDFGTLCTWSQSSWMEALDHYVTNLDELRKVTGPGIEFVKEQDAFKNANNIIAVYQKIIEEAQ